MNKIDEMPAEDRSAAEVLAEAYDEPVEQFMADTSDIPNLDDLESVPEEDRSDNNLDAF